MTYSYIFCPLCGAVKWLTDKTGSLNGARLEQYKCSGCKKFIYTDIIEAVEGTIKYYSRKRFSVVATVGKYIVSVFYHNNSTQFQDADTDEVILVLNSAVTFNWYKNEELIEKIRKYLLFS
jgi:hypothetical protein